MNAFVGKARELGYTWPRVNALPPSKTSYRAYSVYIYEDMQQQWQEQQRRERAPSEEVQSELDMWHAQQEDMQYSALTEHKH